MYIIINTKIWILIEAKWIGMIIIEFIEETAGRRKMEIFKN